MNIKTRLIGFALVSLLFSAALGAWGMWSGRHTGDAAGGNAIATRAMRNHMEADMMHDAVRADVLAAALAGRQKQNDQRGEIERTLAQHTGRFIQSMEENGTLALPGDLRLAIAALRPEVDAYIKDGQRLVALAFGSAEQFDGQLPGFLKAFSDLEPRMAALSERIEKEAVASSASAPAAADLAKSLSGALALAAALCLGLPSLMLVGAVPGKLERVRRAIEGRHAGDADPQRRPPDMDGASKRPGAAPDPALDDTADIPGRAPHATTSLKDSSRKIADIIGAIDGIAFQAHILALNAALEADGAGEQGGGLAVVAAEVRNLAQRSACAAKQIKELLDDSIDTVDAGGTPVDEAEAAMERIVASLKEAAAVMNGISAASLEHCAGIAQIHQAITEMDRAGRKDA